MNNQNIKNFNFNKIELKLSSSAYYDFYLAQDEEHYRCGDYSSSGDCLAVWYDFNEDDTYEINPENINNIISITQWDDFINSGATATTIGLTGLDNGLFNYKKNPLDICNTGLTQILTGSTLIIPPNGGKLRMHSVSGSTNNVAYPLFKITGGTEGDFVRFCGGFYQGYYKLDGYDYEVLPIRSNGWAANFWLRPSDLVCSGLTSTTLNDLYSGNTGFFFYLGTRAENKFWNIFEGNNTGCTKNCIPTLPCPYTATTFCTKPKETDISISGECGMVPLSPPQVVFKKITNQFLIYGRAEKGSKRCGACGSITPSGYGNETACTWDGEPIIIREFAQKVTNRENPFLIYGRADKGSKRCGACGSIEPSGYGNETACTFSGFTSNITELDKDADIVDNAIGFRIRGDGSIGYRLLTVTGKCINETYVSGVTVQEEYSEPGLIEQDEWQNITIRFRPNEIYDDYQLNCGRKRTGTLMFYVDCKLKFKIDDFDEFIAKRLNEFREKQIGVPFNMSLGGGTQGLLESMTFDGQDASDLGLHLEQNFAGTFIGDISQFKFFICDKPWIDIIPICLFDKDRYF